MFNNELSFLLHHTQCEQLRAATRTKATLKFCPNTAHDPSPQLKPISFHHKESHLPYPLNPVL